MTLLTIAEYEVSWYVIYGLQSIMLWSKDEPCYLELGFAVANPIADNVVDDVKARLRRFIHHRLCTWHVYRDLRIVINGC